MKSRRTLGLDEIVVDIWKCLGAKSLELLTSLFNIILRSAKMSGSGSSAISSLCTRIRGICCNYRGIKLLSHMLKIWEKVIEVRSRKLMRVSENQFGFIPGRSSIFT